MMQETPYTFPTTDDFSCAHKRGDADNPLFLLNHWLAVDPPDPVAAEEVNDHEFLIARAQQCAEERGRMPNIVAVDFYGRGDLFDVVKELNGV